MEFAPQSSQHFMTGAYQSTPPFSMGNMANTLPDYQMRNYGQQSFQQPFTTTANQTPAFLYQIPQGHQFASQTATSFNQNFPQQFPTQFQQGQQYRTSNVNYPSYQNTASNNPQSFQNQSFYSHQPVLHQTSYAPHNQTFFRSSQSQYGPSASLGTAGAFQLPHLRLDSNFSPNSGFPYPQYPNQNLSRQGSDSSLRPSIPRGPPRKPKQSGHALWVGNLPPATNVVDLKDHFSRDATTDIESVFLISKSNCAFVNYKTEASCAAAMTRFHDSKFQGVRLVCRLRRGSTPTSATIAPQSSPGTQTPSPGEQQSTVADKPEELVNGPVELPPNEVEDVEKVQEKYFIVKSLTIEDLELSARNGIWATQAHNESTLNKAYQTAQNVYLIFSANKSGEYFGYARMISAIDDEAAASLELPPRQEASEPIPTDLPITIPTAPTATAPKGRIIDDSARGTIFWEADVDPELDVEKTEDAGNISGESEEPGGLSPANPQAFGKPFKILWLSTEKLPFYRTRGLRNPWNANREVKIARDGTELEPNIGRRLTSMFHRPQMPSASPNTSRGQMNMTGGGGYFPQQQQQQYQRPY